MAIAARTKTPVSMRLPHSLVEDVKSYARQSNLTLTDAFEYFLHLGMNADRQAIPNARLDHIEAQLTEIRQMLSAAPAVLPFEMIAEAVADTAKRFPSIERAYVFGSYARGCASASSDIDVRVEIIEGEPFSLRDLVHFAKLIEQATQRSVDVVSARHLKNKALAEAIEKEKVLVYERETR